MNLIYTFTKKLSNKKFLDKIIKVYYKSYENNLRFHNIILYTDIESKYLFENYFHDIRIIDVDELFFLDDYKYSILPHLTINDLLFDADIFLTHPLIISNKDITCESTVGNVLKDENCKYYYETIDILLKYKINDVLNYFLKDLQYIPNIGILKFNNILIQNEFLSHYWKLIEWYKSTKIESEYNLVQNDMRVSGVFGQYLLGLFTRHKKLNIFYCGEHNKYNHLSGGRKFNINFSKTLI